MAKKKVAEEEEVVETEEEAPLQTCFMIKVGKEEYKCVAFKSYWALQAYTKGKDRDTGEEKWEWRSFKYFSDLGSLAGRVYDMRIKASDAKSLKELSDAGKQIAKDVRKEFSL